MDTISKYELREVLGHGGMGIVYRAYDPVMDREVAIKIIQERSLDVPEMKARFIREARMAGKLAHDNIAVIHDLGEVDGKTFIVLEYLRGRDLRSIIDSQEPLPLQEKLDYARQICRGLHFAHTNGIIHRDIKPENIKVLPDHRVKILDFGIAKPYVQTTANAGTTDVALTTVGMRIGTPSCMSPEQVKGLPVDKRSDIFSFGILLYELFTYRKPFRGDDTTVLYKIVHEEPEPIALDDPRLSSDIQRILQKCLAKDPGERYPDCLPLLQDLVAATGLASPGLIAPGLPGVGQTIPNRHHTEDVVPSSPGHTAGQERDDSVVKLLRGNIEGQTVSHFRIVELIGDGGMGVVYKAEDLTLKRTVALKFLLSEGTLNAQAKERFLKEAQTASSLDHPNICTIHEIGETGGGLLFICMAYYPGDNLGKALHARTFSVHESLNTAIRAARGLAKAHEHGIIHRDIKPANIILTSGGEVKIVDFGLAKLSGATQFTHAESVMGTLPYMSPEQIKGTDLDHRTDIWSLGVVLYQSLTGRLPFEGAYEAALFYAIVNETPPMPSQVRPGIPPALDAIVARALAKRVEDRYPSMSDFLADLERADQALLRTRTIDTARTDEFSTLLQNGKLYLERGDYGEALLRFEAALKLMPLNGDAQALRDSTMQKIAEADQADALTREAASLAERGKRREAREILLSVRASHPEHAEAAALLTTVQEQIDGEERLEKLLVDADFYVRRGKLAEARACYTKVLESDPANKSAVRGLKRIDSGGHSTTGHDRSRLTPLPFRATRRRRVIAIGACSALVVLAAFLWRLNVHHDAPGARSLPAVPQIDSLALLDPARQLMLDRRQGAEKAGAPQFAGTSFESARQAQTQGEQALGERHYAAAQQFFERSASLFKTSAGEAAQTRTAATSGTEALKKIVAAMQREMLSQKRAALKAGAQKDAPAEFARAADEEREGDRLLRSGSRDDLIAAHSAYTDAREAYQHAVTEGATFAGLRKAADGSRRDLLQAKAKVTGSDADGQAAPAIKQAAAAESDGEAFYQASDYARARDAFAQSARLYASAADEIRSRRTTTPQTHAVQPPPVASPPSTPDEGNAVQGNLAANTSIEPAAARGEIERMLQQYRESIEQGDIRSLSSLLNLADEKQRSWSVFFSASENRKVSIEGINMDLSGKSARVSFKVKMSFDNMQTNTPESTENARLWTLESQNGAWRIVTQK